MKPIYAQRNTLQMTKSGVILSRKEKRIQRSIDLNEAREHYNQLETFNMCNDYLIIVILLF